MVGEWNDKNENRRMVKEFYDIQKTKNMYKKNKESKQKKNNGMKKK